VFISAIPLWPSRYGTRVGRTVFAAGFGNPTVVILDIDAGDLGLVPSRMNQGDAFDTALARDGWTAVRVGSEVEAYRDGALLSPVMLPPGSQIFPAVEPDCVLLRYLRGSKEPGERAEAVEVMVVDGDGAVRRSGSFPSGAGRGEVETGVLGEDETGSGIWSWDGHLLTPLDGKPIGVLGGRVVLLARPGEVEALDTRTGTATRCPVPASVRRFLSPGYDTTASRLAALANRGGLLVADVAEGPRWLPLDFRPWQSPVWLADGTLLFEDGVVLNVATGATTSLGWHRPRAVPRVEVTGRFGQEEIRAASRPQPMPQSARGQSAAGVRLRAWLPEPGMPAGRSRIGGRPDVPAGRPWPVSDGVPMAFLVQIRLEDVAATVVGMPMPDSGLLSIFAAIEPDGLYPPDNKAVHAAIFPPADLSPAQWPPDLPTGLRFEVAELVPEPLPSAPEPPGADHRMFGPPSRIQDYSPLPADDQGRPLTLLLQLDSDSIAGFGFGDGGRLHFWIAGSDLASGDFGSCLVEIDSY